jgi:hypothetical protein
MKKNDSLRRRRSFRKPRARFLIVCEGELTEPAYFKDIRRSERGIIQLEIVPGGVSKDRGCARCRVGETTQAGR